LDADRACYQGRNGGRPGLGSDGDGWRPEPDIVVHRAEVLGRSAYSVGMAPRLTDPIVAGPPVWVAENFIGAGELSEATAGIEVVGVEIWVSARD
jgi:hypothetical protein